MSDEKVTANQAYREMTQSEMFRHLTKRIESLEKHVADLDARHNGYPEDPPLAERVAALEGLVNEAIPDRFEAVEDTASCAYKRATLNLQEHDRLADRVATVEEIHAHETKMSRAGFKNVVHHIGRLQNRVSALEARQRLDSSQIVPGHHDLGEIEMQQDEAGEEIPEHFDMPGPSRTETRHCLTDEALENLKAEVQASTASAIAERVHGGYWPSFGFISYERRIAMAEDIRREYLTPAGEEEGDQ